MKWTDEEIEREVRRVGIDSRCFVLMKLVREDTIEECKKAVCPFCREGKNPAIDGIHDHCAMIRRHFEPSHE